MQTAYHATSEKIDQFRLEFVGGGEGAAAHGFGIYCTHSIQTALMYRDRAIKGRVYEVSIPNDDSLLDLDSFEQPVTPLQVLEHLDKDGRIPTLVERLEESEGVSPYLDIPSLLTRHLLYYSYELSSEVKAEFPAEFQADIEKLYHDFSFELDEENWTGDDLYKAAARHFVPEHDQQAADRLASELFVELGVAGAKYSDNWNTEATTSYVIFDVSQIRIERVLEPENEMRLRQGPK